MQFVIVQQAISQSSNTNAYSWSIFASFDDIKLPLLVPTSFPRIYIIEDQHSMCIFTRKDSKNKLIIHQRIKFD